jgi:hypothetical protein
MHLFLPLLSRLSFIRMLGDDIGFASPQHDE